MFNNPYVVATLLLVGCLTLCHGVGWLINRILDRQSKIDS